MIFGRAGARSRREKRRRARRAELWRLCASHLEVLNITTVKTQDTDQSRLAFIGMLANIDMMVNNELATL